MVKKRITVVEDILSANERVASENRLKLDRYSVLAINMMASPGAGKTSLIERSLESLAGRLRAAVIDGDIATSIDADRARAAGALAVQVNTGGECHLDAIMLKNALDELDLSQVDILIVENVGNLICPSSFKLGTHFSVLIASVPEGDDKPYKYPPMYRGVDVVVINKTDLLPYVEFDMDYFLRGVEILNPKLISFPLSCRTGEGLENWFAWLENRVSMYKNTARNQAVIENY